jgi:regulator of protease activity HflC (stomatin/prohibitin superfamily)
MQVEGSAGSDLRPRSAALQSRAACTDTVAVVLWLVIVLAAAVLVAAFLLFERVRVLEFERALEYRRGRFSKVLGPGHYWVFRPVATVVKLDVRPRFVSVPGQEVLSSDGVGLRVSVAAEYELVDPARAVNETESFQESLYLTIQLALRQVVGETAIDDLLEKRGDIGARLEELVKPAAEELGLAVRRVELKDIMFPGALKKTFAQVVNARKEGLAALERARGETAALRNLANAARMLDENPALLQLRLLQQIGESGGNTIVLGLPAGGTPVPISRRGLEPPPPPAEPELPGEGD